MPEPDDLTIRSATLADAEICGRLALEPPGGLNAIIGDRDARARIARATFEATGTGFSHERTLVAFRDGHGVIGMVSRFTHDEWPKLRTRTGLVMMRAAGLRYGIDLLRRGRVEERLMPAIPPGRMYVMALAVLAERRSAGVGKRLLGRAVQEAAERGLEAVALDVAAGNDRAIAFYRREGFEVLSERHVPASRGMPSMGSVRMERALAG